MIKFNNLQKNLKFKKLPSFSSNRYYNYQKDVYIRKYELPNDKNLHDELNIIQSIRNEQPNLYRFFFYFV
jgi:hypothetical protein